MYVLNIDQAEFVREYWQQRPMLFRAALPEFSDPVSAEQLAGLAMEEEVFARIVHTREHSWDIESGPFESYARFGESHWQLLVQAVNHWLPDILPLVEAFRFLPDWRFDDLMVSYATPQGGIGPHIDNYDTFILQGQGSRRWQVGGQGAYAPRENDTTGSLVEDFTPIIDVEMVAGDLLYIPPGFPHCGTAQTPAISYSVGFRAPSQQEIFSAFADTLIDEDLGAKRLITSGDSASPGLLTLSEQSGLRALMQALIEDADVAPAVFAKLLSQNRFELDICEPKTPYAGGDISEAIKNDMAVRRIGGLKVLQAEGDIRCRLFVNGEAFLLPEVGAEILALLANHLVLDANLLGRIYQVATARGFLLEMLNRGLYYFEE